MAIAIKNQAIRCLTIEAGYHAEHCIIFKKPVNQNFHSFGLAAI